MRANLGLEPMYTPTGTVQFHLYSDATCTTDVDPPGGLEAPVINGEADSPTIAVIATGTYHWVASYEGDGNNTAAVRRTDARPAEGGRHDRQIRDRLLSRAQPSRLELWRGGVDHHVVGQLLDA